MAESLGAAVAAAERAHRLDHLVLSRRRGHRSAGRGMGRGTGRGAQAVQHVAKVAASRAGSCTPGPLDEPGVGGGHKLGKLVITVP